MKLIKRIKLGAIAIALLFSANQLSAQDTGIKFETGLNWQQIQDKATAEHKNIFVDCYATWCGPCKYMAQKIFTQKNVGDYFNQNFVNVALQMDKTSSDSPNIKDWYEIASKFKSIYSIDAFPTYLFFSAEGQALHSIVGIQTAENFIRKAADASNPTKQYFTVKQSWRQHQSDSLFLFNVLKTVLDVSTTDNDVNEIASAYLKSLHNPITKENFAFLNAKGVIETSQSPWYQLLIKNPTKVDGVLEDKEFSDWVMARIIFKEEVLPVLRGPGKTSWEEIVHHISYNHQTIEDSTFFSFIKLRSYSEIESMIRTVVISSPPKIEDWEKIRQRFQARFTGFDITKGFLYTKISYCNNHKLYGEETKAAYELLNRYDSKTIGFTNTNNLCWNNIFLNGGNDERILKLAVNRMTEVINGNKIKPEVTFLDTYANLLYKSGHYAEALKTQKLAVSLLTEKENSTNTPIRENLQKMLNKKPTWLDNSVVPN